MEKCRVLPLNAHVKRMKSKRELPSFSALVADGIAHAATRCHPAKVVDMDAARERIRRRASVEAVMKELMEADPV
jgi:hypothetical protein